MKQIDFNKLFGQDSYHPLVYKVREGANGAHDAIFLDSYIHDATIFLNNIIFKRGKIDIPLERICWELKNSAIETHTCKSHIHINKVSDYFFTFDRTLLKNWTLPSKINISDFSLSKTEAQLIIKFSLFIERKIPYFEMFVMSASKGNTITITDEIDTFS